LVAALVMIFLISFIWSKIVDRDEILLVVMVLLLMASFPSFITIEVINTRRVSAALAVIENAGPDAEVSNQIKSYLDGKPTSIHSWYLRVAYDDSDVEKRILMTYAPVFEEKTGKVWDRELVYWDNYFEVVVRPLFITEMVVMKK